MIRRLKIQYYLIPITEVVSGTQRGGDRIGEYFAKLYNIKVKKFPPNWNKYGKSAGYIRNKKMAEYADACIALPGGNGTNMMCQLAKEYNLKLKDLRYKKL